MGQYVGIHDVLDARRQGALKSKGEGPRTCVVGPTGGQGRGVCCRVWGVVVYGVGCGGGQTWVRGRVG